MANPTEITRRPWETKPGDVIVRHPDRHDQTGEWTITSECGNDGWFCWLDYRTADGAVGRFVFKPGQMATLRSGATYVVEALLTDDERDAAFHDLSEDDCGHIAAHVRDQFPEIFDAALAAFGRYKAGLPAGPSAVTEAGA